MATKKTDAPEPEFEVIDAVTDEQISEFAEAVLEAITALFDASAVHQSDKTRILEQLTEAVNNIGDREVSHGGTDTPVAMELETKSEDSN
jgi:hypothetical protein